jgi:hypothetical protein
LDLQKTANIQSVSALIRACGERHLSALLGETKWQFPGTAPKLPDDWNEFAHHGNCHMFFWPNGTARA